MHFFLPTLSLMWFILNKMQANNFCWQRRLTDDAVSYVVFLSKSSFSITQCLRACLINICVFFFCYNRISLRTRNMGDIWWWCVGLFRSARGFDAIRVYSTFHSVCSKIEWMCCGHTIFAYAVWYICGAECSWSWSSCRFFVYFSQLLFFHFSQCWPNPVPS